MLLSQQVLRLMLLCLVQDKDTKMATCEETLKQTEDRLKQIEEINNRVGQALVRIELHCAVMNDRIEKLQKEGKDVSLVRELITQVMTEIGA